ncbi:MAG: OprO/OprP family phosphate-selective porin, partial [Bacteroidetes bacterium]|nr:OprO/OprP family phosphate-selective porin [Bacteroidota bacterium]
MKNFFAISMVLLTGASSNGLFAQGCMDSGSNDGVALKGFVQPQYNYNFMEEDADGNDQDENSFYFNRARLGVLGSIPYDFSYYFFVEASPFKNQSGTPHLLDAFVTYSRLAPYAKISIGQFKSPMSQEQNTSCSGLYTVNRSAVVTQLAGPQRDLGLMIAGGNDTTLLSYSIAVMNGSGMGVTDDTKGKDFVGRLLVQPFEMIRAGGS